MMDPLTLALIGAGISAGGQAISAGLQRRAGRQQAAELFGDEEQRRLEELRRLQEAEGFGLTEQQAAAFNARIAGQQVAAARSSQAERLQAAAARPASARDVFLQQVAAEAGRQQAVTDANLLRQAAEERAAATQEAELQQLLLQRAQAAGLRTAGAGAAAGALATGAGQAVSALAAEQQALDMAAAQTGALSTEELLQLLRQQQQGATAPSGYDYSGNI